jgi:hypothetical protein
MFVCPVENREFETLRGWKMHYSAAHGSYSDAELQEAAGAAPPAEETAQARMSDFAATLPAEGEEAENLAAEVTAIPEATDQGIPLEPEKRVRRIKATPKKGKKILTSIPAKILKANGIELDEDDKEGLDEAVEFLESIFGVEFEVPEEKVTIRNRWLAFLYPFAVVLLIVAKHKLGFKFPDGEEKPPDVTV